MRTVAAVLVVALVLGVVAGALAVEVREVAPEAGPAGPPVKPEPVKPEKAVVGGNNAFALDLYGKLREREGNLFFSPFSISTALAMTYAGARGETEAQMAKVLHFPPGREKLHPACKTLIDDLNARQEKGGYELSVANALWGQKGYGFGKVFLHVTRTYYGAGLNEVDFVKAAEAARQRINKWTEEKTRGKIKDLIPPGVLTELTRLVLTNAIYFKGDWAAQFDEKATRDAPFTLLDGEKVDVPMMHQREDFGYMERETFQALALPYVGKELSMVVFLPKEVGGLAELEKSLTAKNLAKWLPALRKRKVRVWLPKFKMTSQFRLDKTLMAMGMADAFTRAADFSGMNGKKDLFISAVIHKAFVDVNEEGTEAAAATAVVVGITSVAPRRHVVFRADHPFLFLIRDNKSGSILFMGRVVNPQGAAASTQAEPQADLSCTISSDKATCQLGEVPKITVRITNNTQQDVFLVGSLDGSDCKWRYPHCYFTIEQPDGKLTPVAYGRCGMMNGLRAENFVKVAPKGSFDPYMRIDFGFFPSSQIRKKTFSRPGLYKLRFVYSTECDDIKKWLGSAAGHWEKNKDPELAGLFERVPKLTLEGNEITIQVVE